MKTMPAAKTKRQIFWVKTYESRCLTNLSMLVKPRKAVSRQERRLHSSVFIIKNACIRRNLKYNISRRKEFGSTNILRCVKTATPKFSSLQICSVLSHSACHSAYTYYLFRIYGQTVNISESLHFSDRSPESRWRLHRRRHEVDSTSGE